MGKRGFGQRRTVLQLGTPTDDKKQPSYGLGYKPPEDDGQRPEGSLTALSGLMSQYAANDDDNDGDDEAAQDDNVAKILNETKSSSDQNGKGANMPLKKFVASSEPPLRGLTPGVSKPAPPPASKAPASKAPASKAPASKQPDHQDSASTSQAGAGVQGKSAEKEGHKDDIDDKLRDFLAEIESIDTDNIDGVPLNENSHGGEIPTTTVENPKLAETKEASREKEGGMEEKQKPAASDGESDLSSGDERLKQPKPSKPKEPVTQWQHCLDESSQCYYYWNMETNDVTWDIPPEFSQYLLRFKQYEENLEKYEKEYAAWKKLQKRKKKRKLSKKSNTDATEDSSETSLTNDKPSNSTISDSKPLIGPEKSLNSTTQAVIGPQLPPALQETSKTVQDKSKVKGVVPYDFDTTADDSFETSHTKMEVESSELTSPTITSAHKRENKHERTHERIAEHKHEHRAERISEHKAERMLEHKPEHKSEHKHERKHSSDKSKHGNKASSKSSRHKKKHHRRSSTEERMDYSEHSGRRRTGDKKKEQALRDSTADDDDVDDEFDVDDIDRELEQALDRRRASADDEMKESRQVEEKKSSSKKSIIQEREPHGTKSSSDRSAQQVVAADKSMYRITMDDIKHRNRILSEIVELSDEILNKLEVAGASMSDIDRLYVHLIQTQTRIQDWKAGGLDTEYLLRQLVETSTELASCQTTPQLARCQASAGFDESAENEGKWLAHWDSSHERHLYINQTTGVATWEEPPMGTIEAGEDISGLLSYKELNQSNVGYINSSTSIADNTSTCIPSTLPSDIFTLVEKTPPPPPPSPPPEGPHYPHTSSDWSENVTNEKSPNQNETGINSSLSKTSQSFPQDSGNTEEISVEQIAGSASAVDEDNSVESYEVGNTSDADDNINDDNVNKTEQKSEEKHGGETNIGHVIADKGGVMASLAQYEDSEASEDEEESPKEQEEVPVEPGLVKRTSDDDYSRVASVEEEPGASSGEVVETQDGLKEGFGEGGESEGVHVGEDLTHSRGGTGEEKKTSGTGDQSQQQQQEQSSSKEPSSSKKEKKKRTKGAEFDAGPSVKRKKLLGLVEKWQKVQLQVEESRTKQQLQEEELQQIELEVAKRKAEAAAKRKQPDS